MSEFAKLTKQYTCERECGSPNALCPEGAVLTPVAAAQRSPTGLREELFTHSPGVCTGLGGKGPQLQLLLGGLRLWS